MLSALWLLSLGLLGIWGIWTGDALLTLTTVLAALFAASLWLWQRYCLAGLSYRRRLSAGRVLFGGTIELRAELTNLKPLPLTWVRVDEIVPQGLAIDGHVPNFGGLTSRLSLLFAMLPYQRVTRRLRLHCRRRGEHGFGPALLESGDYLGALSRQAKQPQIDRLIVYPKLFPLQLRGLPANQLLGRNAVRRPMLTDPLRVIGAREYQRGNSYRAIDWRATARRDRIMVRMFEPSTTPVLDIVMNFQTTTQGWSQTEADALEFAISIAGSLAAHGAEHGWAVGLRGNGSSDGAAIACAPNATSGQLRTILEMLARADTAATGPLPPLLAVPQRAGATLLLVTTMLSHAILQALRAQHRNGRAILVVHVARDYEPRHTAPFPILRVDHDAQWTERDALVLAS